jgi:hypothetical protein
MQGYSKSSVGPFITEHYNGLVESLIQGYSKVRVEPFITGHYNR